MSARTNTAPNALPLGDQGLKDTESGWLTVRTSRATSVTTSAPAGAKSRSWPFRLAGNIPGPHSMVSESNGRHAIIKPQIWSQCDSVRHAPTGPHLCRLLSMSLSCGSNDSNPRSFQPPKPESHQRAWTEDSVLHLCVHELFTANGGWFARLPLLNMFAWSMHYHVHTQ